MNQTQNTQPQQTKKNVKESTGFRLVVLGMLTLVLMIPMAYVSWLIDERQNNKEQASHEIDRAWGGPVTLAGPILKIPYRYHVTQTNSKGEKVRVFKGIRYFYILPQDLHIKANIQTTTRHKGIYRAVVFRSETALTGSFKRPYLAGKYILPQDILWKSARWEFVVSNGRNLTEKVSIELPGQQKIDFLPDEDKHLLTTKPVFATKPLGRNPFEQSAEIRFSINFTLKGSRELNLVPLGKTTRVSMQSDWPHPSFTGEFLPDNSPEILPDNQGFNAQWKIIEYQRPFKTVYDYQIDMDNMKQHHLGVRLLIPVDHYHKTKRAAKYAYLIIFLTFMLFFIIQQTARVPVHVFHYFLVGLALVVFYTLLLSISEQWNFGAAYAVSAVATVGLIGWYARSVLHSKRFAAQILLGLGLLYTYIYTIVSLQDYALLVGSIGLFIIVAVIMYFSRRIRWD